MMELHIVSTGSQPAEKILAVGTQVHHQVTAIHIREKQWSDDQVKELIQVMLQEGIPAAKIRLNSRVQLAAELGIGGIHLPEQHSFNRAEADRWRTSISLSDNNLSRHDMKSLLQTASASYEPEQGIQHPWKYIAGRSVHTTAHAIQAEQEGMDYLFYGHIYKTPSKRGVPARGIHQLHQLCGAVHIPVIAIGGIQPQHAEELVRAGAAGIAVMSGIFAADDPAEQAAAYRAALSAASAVTERT
ncbi:thiamine phosphate synthase [Paenibacillus wulumuqiensis]|uniref:thiamine phosphate synthase n=1 Tax=Paenibacillus wulumuqiensis TaxID=1567107 RepID=UPI0009E1B3C4|nr:thiamine phosphate synthase [Paenibacillus wulumuqiensis]